MIALLSMTSMLADRLYQHHSQVAANLEAVFSQRVALQFRVDQAAFLTRSCSAVVEFPPMPPDSAPPRRTEQARAQ